MRTNAVQALLRPFRHCATTRYPEQKSLRIIAAASCLRAARERGARISTHETLATAIAPRKARRRPWRCSSPLRACASSTKRRRASRVAGLGWKRGPETRVFPGQAARLDRVASSTLTAHTDTKRAKTTQRGVVAMYYMPCTVDKINSLHQCTPAAFDDPSHARRATAAGAAARRRGGHRRRASCCRLAQARALARGGDCAYARLAKHANR